MTNQDKISIIIDSYYNGQRRKMVDQINTYGMPKFWGDLNNHISENLLDDSLLGNILLSYMSINKF